MRQSDFLSLEIEDMRQFVYERDGGMCHKGHPVSYGDCQLAHIVAKTKANYLKWGNIFNKNVRLQMRFFGLHRAKLAVLLINHPDNLVLSCAKHNSSAMIGMKGKREREHMEAIMDKVIEDMNK